MSDRQDIFEQETYLSFEDGYPERPVSWFKSSMLPKIRNLLANKKLLLDVGCASGYYTKEFAPFIERIVGVDYAYNRIKYAKEHFEGDKLKFIHSRVDQLKVDRLFDAMFTSMVFQHMPLDIKMQSFENLATLASDDCLFLMYEDRKSVV
jgi:2-polyprenyl-3-methyl-5-hydroxy-6-metoxy-1,4-benzoquinol methylase